MEASSLGGYLVSVPIPWDEHGRLLPELLRGAIRKLLRERCDGIYLFGTSGEGYAVSDEELAQIVDVFGEETAEFGGFRQVGCFGLSSDQVKRRCSLVAERGIEGVQITLPFWKELNDRELLRYFEDVCNSFPGLSFLLYNNPRNKRRLKGVELQMLHQRCPNLHGAKTGSGTWLDFFELITQSPALRHFVTEAAFLFCHGLGAAGLIPSSSYAMPQQTRSYYEAVIANDLARAHRLHAEILRFFHRTAVPLLAKGYIDGAIDKAYARIGGMEMPLNMKSPYVALADEDYECLESVIRTEFAGAGGV